MARIKEPIHRISAAGSVQALVIDDDILFAGLQGGVIAAYSLETFELQSSVQAHEDSVLGLHLSPQHDLLISTGADSIANIWSTQSLTPLYSVHSYYEVGDIFSVAYSPKLQTVLLGAQNGSISWYQFRGDRDISSDKVESSPGTRKHRFFDSHGPGGSLDPLQLRHPNGDSTAGGYKVTIPNTSYKAYSHKSYVYTMLLAKGLFQDDHEEEVLITGGGDGTIKLWKVEDLSDANLIELFKFQNKGNNVLSLAYDGFFLYAGLADGYAHIYNLSSCQLIQKLSIGHGDVSQIQSSCGSIICGTSEGWLKVSGLDTVNNYSTDGVH